MANGYRVEWVIDIDEASSARDAAKQAWEHMRADGSIANHFTAYVHDGDGEGIPVDLSEEPEIVVGSQVYWTRDRFAVLTVWSVGDSDAAVRFGAWTKRVPLSELEVVTNG